MIERKVGVCSRLFSVNDNATGTSWIKWWDHFSVTYSAKAVYVDTLCDPSDPSGDTDLDYGGWGDNDWFPVEKTFAVGDGFLSFHA